MSNDQILEVESVETPLRPTLPPLDEEAMRMEPVAAYQEESALVRGLLGALAGAVAGAAVWALVAAYLSLEWGWIAWGVGLAVGKGCVWAGGRGTSMAVAGALLTLLSIVGGKMAAFHLVMTEGADEFLTQEVYAEVQRDATDFHQLGSQPSAEQVAAFMISHEYTDSMGSVEVPFEEIEWFNEYQAPFLEEFAAKSFSFEQWKERTLAEFQSSVSATDSLVAGLHPLDALFILIGLACAFRIIRGAELRSAV